MDFYLFITFNVIRSSKLQKISLILSVTALVHLSVVQDGNVIKSEVEISSPNTD